MEEGLNLGFPLGLLLGLFITSFLDRKHTIMLGMLIVEVGLVVCLFGRNVPLVSVGLFLWGFGS